MLRSLEAVIGKDGRVTLCEPVEIGRECRAIVTIIDDPVAPEVALLSEPVLAEDWERPEEEEAWSHLKSSLDK